MKAVSILVALALSATLCVIGGCASDTTKQYAAYIQLTKDQDAAKQKAADERQQAFASLAAKCQGDECVRSVALTMALDSGRGTGPQPTAIQPPIAEPSLGRQVLLTLLNGNLAGTLVSGAVQWHASDNQTKSQLGEYNFLSAAIGDMKSSISVGGNYVPGQYYAGGYIGGSANGPGAGIGNSGIGNTTTTTTTSTSGTGNGVNGSAVDNSHDNRTTSPGPFTNSGNGGTCSSGSTTGAAGSGNGGTCPGSGG